jgi:hypothetical protein
MADTMVYDLLVQWTSLALNINSYSRASLYTLPERKINFRILPAILDIYFTPFTGVEDVAAWSRRPIKRREAENTHLACFN